MEGDAVYLADPVAIEEFQSTPSVWRETAQSIAINSDYKISIHSLRMEGDTNIWDIKACTGISIHSLRMEGDSADSPQSGQSDISIHSLRMEGDSFRLS